MGQIQNSTRIIPTRFVKPQLPRDYITRPHLLDRLASASSEQQLTFLHAPAGYGKTSLMVELCEQCADKGLKASWLTLDERMSNEENFLNHLGAALLEEEDRRAQTAPSLAASDDPIVSLSSILFDDNPDSQCDTYLFIDRFEQVTTPPQRFLRRFSSSARSSPLGFTSLLQPASFPATCALQPTI